jgi:V8-like Glu-specific endopeptidase
MKRLVLLCLTLALTVGCSPDLDPDDVAFRASAIVNGTSDLAHDPVGIVYGGGMGGCTGTLIAANKVLTAAHCVLTQTQPYKVMYPIYFYVGDMFGPKYKAISVATHPSYAGGNQADLAVFVLDKNVPNAAPYTMSSVAPKKGEKVTIVGYGLPGDNVGAFGWKRRGETEVDQVLPAVFTFSGGTGTQGMVCNGDSGGPSFIWRNNKEILVGVHSTSAKGCDSYGVDMRVDAYLNWITTLKVTMKVYGGDCLTSKDCTSGICMPSGSKYICTQQCDSKACPSEDKCLTYSGPEANKVCLPGSGASSAQSVGADCASDVDCKSNICAAISASQKICTQICDMQKQNCPASFKCIASVLGGLCVPGGPPGAALGESCDDDYDCASNTCAKLNGTAACATWCDTNTPQACPTGYTCQAIAGKPQGLCLKTTTAPPVKKAFGADCTKHDECKSGLCGADGDGRTFCTSTCDPAQGCTAGAGYDCVPAGDGTHVCAPTAAGDDDSGCALAGSRAPRWPLLLLALPLLLLRRRRG